VIYIGLRHGEPELRAMYRHLNQGVVGFREQFPYHPHVTLAQNIPPDDVIRLYELAQRCWAEYHQTKSFHVEVLDFVKNIYANKWIDLAAIQLKPVEALTPK
jgi:2'-5' RNA ligase